MFDLAWLNIKSPATPLHGAIRPWLGGILDILSDKQAWRFNDLLEWWAHHMTCIWHGIE